MACWANSSSARAARPTGEQALTNRALALALALPAFALDRTVTFA